jgi:hypothetical protein
MTDASAAEILENLEKDWAKEPGWSKIGSDKTRTNWRLVEKTGEIWSAWASAEPANEKGKVIVTFGITSQRKKTASIKQQVIRAMIERLQV